VCPFTTLSSRIKIIFISNNCLKKIVLDLIIYVLLLYCKFTVSPINLTFFVSESILNLVVLVCRDNLQLLRQRYYYATWKADGTRYMMLITMDGCYLIDRNFNCRRVQMRFPCRSSTNEVLCYFIFKISNSGCYSWIIFNINRFYSMCKCHYHPQWLLLLYII